MKPFLISPLALQDLDEIWAYIASDNIDAANRVQDEFFSAFDLLTDYPGAGHLREDLADRSLRFWRVRRYLIIYRPDSKPLQIVRVLHGARDICSLLKEPGALD